MNEIKCPHCGKAFTIDEAGYADILKQVHKFHTGDGWIKLRCEDDDAIHICVDKFFVEKRKF